MTQMIAEIIESEIERRGIILNNKCNNLSLKMLKNTLPLTGKGMKWKMMTKNNNLKYSSQKLGHKKRLK